LLPPAISKQGADSQKLAKLQPFNTSSLGETMINVSGYLVAATGHEWSVLLASWTGLLPQGFALWMVNRIGDVIGVAGDGAVYWLDVGTEQVARIAASRDDFMVKINEGSNARQWLATPLIDECVAAGMMLQPGQCYGFKVAPLLGGDYVVENMEPVALAEHYARLAKASAG
jgi:hypothetical protein